MRVARNLICADTRELPAAAQAAAKRRFRVEGKRDIQTKVMTTLSTGVSRPNPLQLHEHLEVSG